MTCSICSTRYALAHPIADKTGLLVPMCIECAAQHARPSRFPTGTQRTGRMPPATDFADDERAALAREVELRTAQASALATMLRGVLEAFPELRTSLVALAPQQQVLREARALLVEVGL